MSWFNDTKVGRRLTVVFGTIGVIFVALGTGALWSQRALDRSNQATLSELDVSNLAGEFASQLFAGRLLLASIVLSNDGSTRTDMVARLKDGRQKYQDAFKQIRARIDEPEGKALVDRIEAGNAELRDLNGQVLSLAMAGKNAEAGTLFLRECLPRMERHRGVVVDLEAWRKKRAGQSQQSAASTAALGRAVVIGLVLGGLLISGWFAVTITRSLKSPLIEVSQTLLKVADGDLTQEVAAGLTRDATRSAISPGRLRASGTGYAS